MKDNNKLIIIIISSIISIILFSIGVLNQIKVLTSIPFILVLAIYANMGLEGGFLSNYKISRFIRPGSFSNYFVLKDDYNIFKKNMMYPIMIGFVGIIAFYIFLWVILPNFNSDLQFLINTGISLILLSATFSILSFNYSTALNKEKDIIIASGRRFLLATFLAVMFLGISLILTLLGPYISFPANYNVIEIIIYYLKPTIYIILASILAGFSFHLMIFLIEGFYLVLKGTIEYKE